MEVSPSKSWLPLVGQPLTVEGDSDARAGVGFSAFEGDVEVDGAHDAVAEVFVDQRLESRSVDLQHFVESVDGRIGWGRVSNDPRVGTSWRTATAFSERLSASPTRAARSGGRGCCPRSAAVSHTRSTPKRAASSLNVRLSRRLAARTSLVACARVRSASGPVMRLVLRRPLRSRVARRSRRCRNARRCPRACRPCTMRYSSRMGRSVEQALEDLARPGRVARLRRQGGPGDVRRHAVMRHGPPRMVGRRAAVGTRHRRRSRRAGRFPAPRTTASRSQILPRAVFTR